MINLLKAEFYKLFHSLEFWCIALISILLSSILLMDSSSIVDNLLLASLYNTPLLYFMTIIFAALFVGNDLGERTLYGYICSGYKRGLILFVKALVYQTACIIILILPLILHGMLAILKNGNIALVEQPMWILGCSIIITILAQCMLPMLFAFVFRDIGKTMAAPMILFFLTIFVLNGDADGKITLYIPMGQLRLISLQQMPLSIAGLALLDVFYIVVCFVGAYMCFCSSDLK